MGPRARGLLHEVALTLWDGVPGASEIEQRLRSLGSRLRPTLRTALESQRA